MNICLVHGSNRKGNTDRTLEIIKDTLDKHDNNITYSNIYLPKDLPCFCEGCFACILTGDYGGENCPHKIYTNNIKKILLSADGIVFASPCYAMAETGQVKAFLDHFACNYVMHRPNEEMFSKVALVISTAAGAGTGRAVSTISRNLLFWGIKRIVKCRINIWEANWDKMLDKKRIKAEKIIEHKASEFYNLTKNRYKIHSNVLSVLLRKAAKFMVSSDMANEKDRIYWKSKGWL